MNTPDELDLRPSDFSFLRSIGIKVPWFCRRHPGIELPLSRHPRRGEMRHYTGCFLCQRERRRARRLWKREEQERKCRQLRLAFPAARAPLTRAMILHCGYGEPTAKKD